jgi:hypothetical protein
MISPSIRYRLSHDFDVNWRGRLPDAAVRSTIESVRNGRIQTISCRQYRSQHSSPQGTISRSQHHRNDVHALTVTPRLHIAAVSPYNRIVFPNFGPVEADYERKPSLSSGLTKEFVSDDVVLFEAQREGVGLTGLVRLAVSIGSQQPLAHTCEGLRR